MNATFDMKDIKAVTASFRAESSIPVAHRLYAKKTGELVLQGLYCWDEYGPEGRFGGSDWRDIPTVYEETDLKND